MRGGRDVCGRRPPTRARAGARVAPGVLVVAVVATLASVLSACGRAGPTGSTSPRLAVPRGADAERGPVGPWQAPGGRFLEDRYGRVVLAHGVNLVYKVPPYEITVDGSGINTLTAEEAQRMASLGFDLVRLGILWKGLEPGTASTKDPAICTPGLPRASGPHQFDAAVLDAYLAKLEATVELLGSYGISSLIDMHQDVYSEVFGGEGAPDWAVCTDSAVPEPVLHVPDWSVNLNGPGVVTAYDHFWRNDVVGDLQGEFDGIWARVAGHFRDNPWVVGYDPFNEPYGQGVPPRDTGVAFDAMLECFYTGRGAPGLDQDRRPLSCPPDDPETGLIPRILNADPNHLVFYEGNYATDSGPVNHVGPMPFGHLVLNFHDYCFLHVPNGPEPADFGTICGPIEGVVFAQHASQAARDASPAQPGGIPTLLTEFGATTDTADLSRITADADTRLVGWTYWQWLHYDDPTGSHSSGLWPPSDPTPAMLPVLSRAYAMAVAGTPLAEKFDPGSARFVLRYRSDPKVAAPTVVFVPTATHYQDGYCATAIDARVTSPPGSDHLDVEGPRHARTVTVTVAPGACQKNG